MKAIYLIAIIAASTCTGALHAVQSSETIAETISFEYRYLLHFPEDYDQVAEKNYPLVLFLHGRGERGDDLNLVRKHGPPSFLDERPEFPAIVISPQCPISESWSPLKLNALLEEAVTKYRVDQSRIYLTGLSMGGNGTWMLATYYPHWFAAIAPICGWGEDFLVGRHLKNIPIWAFHGLQDKAVPLEQGLRLVRAVENDGGNIRFTVYSDAKHDSWTRTYENPEFWDWLFDQRKPD